jgi:uracil-DNA glycosylase
MPELRIEQGVPTALPGISAGAPAARLAGEVGRIEAARAGGGARRAHRRVAETPGVRGVGMSLTVEERREALVDLYREVEACTRCPLHETRTKAVFGAGNADADLMFVGEAPGAEEDRQGIPFVGRAGQLLNDLLEEIGLSRDEVFIANVLKSRPPGNRDPQPAEIEACRPYLFEQVRLIEPKVVCTLGNFATKLLSGNPAGITRVRGTPQVHRLGGRAVFLLPLFHPAAGLRTPAVKETLRSDFASLPALLSGPEPGAPPEEVEDEIEEAPVPGPPQPPDDQLDLFG